MAPKESIERLRRDRERLRASLRDYHSGKYRHMDQKELGGFIALLERRIAALDAKINGDADG